MKEGIKIIFQAKMYNILKFQLLNWENLLFFFLFCDHKLNICGFCPAGRKHLGL